MALSPSQAFGQAVREIRKQQGLSQEQAALNSGIDRAYVGHIERATKTPTTTTIFRLAEGLGVRPSVIFARAEMLLAGDVPGQGDGTRSSPD